ncbi:MAG TPA: ABC transporter substrate-binding protein [Stellaceae bacterium]|nr:ABC transporter substrate-binding protein [Stellaceae bacterium]
MVSRVTRRVALGALVGSVAAAYIKPAKAGDTLRVGKAVAENFGYTPLDIGIAKGIFARQDIEISLLNFTGGAKIAQAMAAGAVDISLSAGPDMQFVAKGAPEIAIASITESPVFMGLCIGNDSPVKTIDGLKGQQVGVASLGSLTYWLIDELNRVKGWKGDDRARQVVVGGSTAASLAALKTKQVAASLSATQTGFLLEDRGEGRLLADCGQYVGPFELFTTFASTDLTQKNPDAVRRFLAAWYETVDFMRKNKDAVVPLCAKAMTYPPNVASRAYDVFMPGMSTDGRLRPQAIEALKSSFADLKAIDGPVDMTKLYTETYLPKI